MRLFVASSLTHKVLAQALSYQPAATKETDLLRPDMLHMTLQFIGEAEPGRVKHALQSVQFEAFRTRFSQAGLFSPKKGKHVLWLGIELTQALSALQKQISQALRDSRIPIDKRQYTPHITLARCRRSIDPLYLDRFLEQSVQTIDYPIEQFHLYQSHRRDGRLCYDILESYGNHH